MFGGYYRLIKGRIRHCIYLSYFTALQQKGFYGAWCRLWERLHALSEAELKSIQTLPWRFEAGQTVQVKGMRRIGMVMSKWYRRGRKIYEVKIGRWYYSFWESEIIETKYRLYGKVVIEELPHKTLSEGTFCTPTKRPWVYTTPYNRYAHNLHRW